MYYVDQSEMSITCQGATEPGLQVLVQIFSGCEGVLPHTDGGAVVDSVAELGQRHVELDWLELKIIIIDK